MCIRDSNIVVSGSSGKSPWTMSAATLEVSDIVYNLSGYDRRLRNDSTAGDSFLALNGGGVNGGMLINLSTSRNFSINAFGSGATPHLLTVQLKTSGTFNSEGTASDTVLGGNGLVINAPVAEIGGSRSLKLTGAGAITLSGTNSYTGGTTVNMTGGTVLMSGSGTAGVFNGTLGSGASALTVQSGTLDLGTSIQRVGAVVLTGGVIQSGTLTGDSYTAIGSGTATVNSVLAGAGGLTKSGSGKLVLGGINSYTGATSVTGGLLIVSGNIAGSACNVAGGTLRGTGTTGAITAQASGSVGPGTETTTGILSAASLDLQSGAHLAIRLGGTVAGTGYDRLAVAGGISLAGDLDVSLVHGFTPSGATQNPETHNYNLDGDKFFIMLGTGAAGAFGNVGSADPYLPGFGTVRVGEREFAISFSGNALANTFTGGSDLVLMAIPEPGTNGMIVLGLGVMIGVCGYRHCKRDWKR